MQNPTAGILGVIIKGLKGKADGNAKLKGSFTAQTPSELLESIFLKESFVEPSIPNPDDPIEELSIGSLPLPIYVKVFTLSAAYLSRSISMQMT